MTNLTYANKVFSCRVAHGTIEKSILALQPAALGSILIVPKYFLSMLQGLIDCTTWNCGQKLDNINETTQVLASGWLPCVAKKSFEEKNLSAANKLLSHVLPAYLDIGCLVVLVELGSQRCAVFG